MNLPILILGDYRAIKGPVDAVICDPPYGNFFGSQRKKITTALVAGDDLEYLPHFAKWVFDICPVGPVVVFCDRCSRTKFELELSKHANFINDAVWFKKPWGIGYNFRPAHEHILLFSKSKSIKASHFKLSSVLQANKVAPQRKVHPTQKPIDLMEQLVVGLTMPGALVCDPFMGSGSTAVAAIKNGRLFVGADIQSSHVEIAKQRVKELK